MQCDQFRQLVDSYLNNELIVETNHQIISHLERCPDCRRELAARRELRLKLRRAFTNAPENQMRPEFANHLVRQLHDDAMGLNVDSEVSTNGSRSVSRARRNSLLAIAACVVLATGISLVMFRHRIFGPSQPRTPETAQTELTKSNSSELSSGGPVNLVKTELAKSAVGDHRDCAIHFRLTDKPIDLEVAGRKYDPVYLNLVKAVMSEGNTPLDVEFVEAHSCVFEARRFAHIVLKYHGRLVSFLVTDSVPATGLTEPTSQSHVIACSQFDGYQVSCFQTRSHAVFVVSDMPEGENLALARALAPPVYAHITRVETAG